MSNKDNPLYIGVLKKLGYEVICIPTSNKKEADFLIKYKKSQALVEAKLKLDSKEDIDEREEILKKGEVYVNKKVLGSNNTISGIIGKASTQLKSSSDKEHDFKIILFIASGINSKTKADQFEDTIYGSTLTHEFDSSIARKKCYFYRYSDFKRYENVLDAVIIGYIFQDKISTLRLCLNPFSKNYKVLKSSEFIKPFNNEVTDPCKEEQLGEAYILDEKYCNTENSPNFYSPIVSYLAKKYNTNQLLVGLDLNAEEYTSRFPIK